MSLQQFCQRPVMTISPEMDLIEACQLLQHHTVGCLVVEEEGKLCCILTDRDIALKAIGQGKDPRGMALLARNGTRARWAGTHALRQRH